MGQLFAVAWRATKVGHKRGIHEDAEAGEDRRRHTPGLSARFLGIPAAHCSANGHTYEDILKFFRTIHKRGKGNERG